MIEFQTQLTRKYKKTAGHEKKDSLMIDDVLETFSLHEKMKYSLFNSSLGKTIVYSDREE